MKGKVNKIVFRTLFISSLILSSVIMPVSASETTLAASNTTNLKTTINDKGVSLRQPAIFQGGQVLIPMSDIFKAFGADSVTADSKSKTITAVKGKTVVKVTQGKKTAVVNGKTIPLPTETRIINGRTMVSSALLPKFTSVKTTFNKTAKTIDFKGNTSKAPTVPVKNTIPLNKEDIINKMEARGFYKHGATGATLNIWNSKDISSFHVAVDLTDDTGMLIIIKAWSSPDIPESAVIPDNVKYALEQIIPSGSTQIYNIVNQVAQTGDHSELDKLFNFDGLKTRVNFRKGTEIKVIFSR